MDIVTQNKAEIVNYETINFIDIMPMDDGRFEIDANFAHCITELGYYATEDRAKEIVKEITTAHSNFNYFKNATEEGKNYIINLLKSKYKQFNIYEMPSE